MKMLLFCFLTFSPFSSDAQISLLRDKVNKLISKLENQSIIAERLEREKNALLSDVQRYRIINRETKKDLTETTVSL